MPQVRVNNNIPGFSGAEIVIQLGHDELMGGRLDLTAAMQEGAKEVAKAYIEQNMAEVLKGMDPAAITNLAIAESAKMVREKFIDPPKKEKESK